MDKFLEKHGFVTEDEKVYGYGLLVMAIVLFLLFCGILFNYVYTWMVLNG